VIIRREGPGSPLRQAVGGDAKAKASMALYLTGTLSALTIPHAGVGIALACFVTAAVAWIIPDRRIDRVFRQHEPAD
jgi:hypothetical protein